MQWPSYGSPFWGLARQVGSIELPTLVLAFTIYAGWIVITWWWRELPPLLGIIGSWLLA